MEASLPIIAVSISWELLRPQVYSFLVLHLQGLSHLDRQLAISGFIAV